MAAITTAEQICNLALSGLGNRNTVNNIVTPKTDKELVFALWYDICRQWVLKTMMPNFALDRIVVSQKTVPAGYVNDYAYAWEYPNSALRILGMNSIDCIDTPPTVEGNLIFTNTPYPDGLTLRVVKDITDVTIMSVEYIIQLAKELEKRTAAAITQDPAKKAAAAKEVVAEAANTTALNAQENKPIRRSTSRFRQARAYNVSTQPSKK